MRWLLIAVVAAAAAADPSVPTTESLVADHAVRYVNQDVITFGDVLERGQGRVMDLRRRGQPLPSGDAERLRFLEDTLEELTDEQLLLQYAQQLKVTLDKDRIALAVLDRARHSGLGLTLRDQTRERERIERRETIRAVLGYFEDRTAHVAPAELWDYYRQHEAEFRRPARAHVYQIMLRPSGDSDRRALRDAKLAIFRRAQEPGVDAAIAAQAAPRVDAYLAAADDAGKDAQLDALVAALAGLATDTLSRDGKALVADAVDAQRRQATIRDAAQTDAALEAIRAQVADKGIDAFAAAAKASSEGPRADQGGDLGWVEPGTYAKAFEDQVFALPSGGLSPVFRSEQVACLVYVSERQDATQRSFAEVTGEIETTLRQRRAEDVKRRTVAMLRAQGSIRDLVSLRSLLLSDGQ